MEKLKYKNIGEKLIEVVPEFKNHYENHNRDNFGVILPHVLFGDFARFIIAQSEKSEFNSAHNDIPERAFEFIEKLFATGDDELEELISVSFLENLYHQNKNLSLMRKLLEPKAKAQFQIIENWKQHASV